MEDGSIEGHIIDEKAGMLNSCSVLVFPKGK